MLMQAIIVIFAYQVAPGTLKSHAAQVASSTNAVG